jgi:hypothetical protein
MNEVVNVILLNVGLVVIAAIAYFWGLATKEVRYEAKIKELEANKKRSFFEGRR